MSRGYEVVTSPSNAMYDIKQTSCVSCVANSGTRLKMLIFFCGHELT